MKHSDTLQQDTRDEQGGICSFYALRRQYESMVETATSNTMQCQMMMDVACCEGKEVDASKELTTAASKKVSTSLE
jgi:hypothetical protein